MGSTRTSPCSRTTPRERVERLPADSIDHWEWECAATSPGVAADPAQLGSADLAWIPAAVPGTAAGALRAHGAWMAGTDDAEILDGQDWWFRCRFADPGAGLYTLHLGGLATLADVWLNGAHLLHSENMFLEHACEIDQLQPENELCIRFAALEPELARKRPRPRWKTALARRPNLRWIRTTLLGRMDGWAGWAAPVGPWRPIELVARPRARASSRRRSRPNVKAGAGRCTCARDARDLGRSTGTRAAASWRPGCAAVVVGEWHTTDGRRNVDADHGRTLVAAYARRTSALSRDPRDRRRHHRVANRRVPHDRGRAIRRRLPVRRQRRADLLPRGGLGTARCRDLQRRSRRGARLARALPRRGHEHGARRRAQRVRERGLLGSLRRARCDGVAGLHARGIRPAGRRRLRPRSWRRRRRC